ncbi:uncharacterized protein LOC120417955 isoform X3 [Culex pipiens pallens]|uniref:uncharacterized protein LOC120417955 isoform X3 n=1 Tax=Culex pipiens pallens TaxID=42434 RepID=UPI00195329CC|nr:uncharacterized protein LOC120417955 isoform X3 [Culex pipiens pallens]
MSSTRQNLSMASLTSSSVAVWLNCASHRKKLCKFGSFNFGRNGVADITRDDPAQLEEHRDAEQHVDPVRCVEVRVGQLDVRRDRPVGRADRGRRNHPGYLGDDETLHVHREAVVTGLELDRHRLSGVCLHCTDSADGNVCSYSTCVQPFRQLFRNKIDLRSVVEQQSAWHRACNIVFRTKSVFTIAFQNNGCRRIYCLSIVGHTFHTIDF